MHGLPEGETTRRSLALHLEGRNVYGFILRRPDLRWPITGARRGVAADSLPGNRPTTYERRATAGSSE